MISCSCWSIQSQENEFGSAFGLVVFWRSGDSSMFSKCIGNKAMMRGQLICKYLGIYVIIDEAICPWKLLFCTHLDKMKKYRIQVVLYFNKRRARCRVLVFWSQIIIFWWWPSEYISNNILWVYQVTLCTSSERDAYLNTNSNNLSAIDMTYMDIPIMSVY